MHYKGLIVSLLHLLVPLVAGTQRGGGVINELVAYYTKQWGSWQMGPAVQMWCQRRLVGILRNTT